VTDLQALRRFHEQRRVEPRQPAPFRRRQVVAVLVPGAVQGFDAPLQPGALGVGEVRVLQRRLTTEYRHGGWSGEAAGDEQDDVVAVANDGAAGAGPRRRSRFVPHRMSSTAAALVQCEGRDSLWRCAGAACRS
jgi:hypothetical protein